MNKLGYTLLEVTLFMAISAALAVVAFVGLGPRLRNIRFTDSVRSLESNVTKNFAERVSGVNRRVGQASCTPNAQGILIVGSGTDSAGAAERCISNGVAAIFGLDDTDRVVYRNIISLRNPVSGCTEPENTLSRILQCHNATIVTSGPTPDTVYSYANGLNQVSDPTAFAFIIDPLGSTTHRLQITDTSVSGYSGLIGGPNFQLQTNLQDDFMACFAMSSRSAQFVFSNQSLTPAVAFDGECV